jgi:peptidoglycan hydrolase-like protein with peptidoglycan-binding domain
MASYYQIGSKGDGVKKLQQALVSAGYNVGSSGADGVFGKDTQAAVKAYQKANNLAVDGIAGTQTLSSLYKPVQSTPSVQSAKPVQSTPSVQSAKPVQTTVQQPAQQNTLSIAQPVQQTTTTPKTDLSSLNNYNPTVTVPEYKSPFEEQISAALNKYLNPEPFSYNVNTDPTFNSYAGQYVRAGENAYQDTIGDLTSLTGGRLNSWAVSAASQAKNKYMQDLANIIPQLEQNAYNRYVQNYQNIAGQLKALQNMDIDAYNKYKDNLTATQIAEDRAKQNYLDTIGQYSNDYQARINQVQNDNDPSNDWEVPYLTSARQDKITAQKAAEAKAAEAKSAAEQQQWENAMAAWKQSGTVSSKAMADILGVPVGSRTADYNIDSINAATSAKNASTSAYNATTSRMNAENSIKKDADSKLQKAIDDYSDYIDSIFLSPVQVGTDNTGKPVYSSQKVLTVVNKAKLESYLGQLIDSGIDPDIVDALAAKYGV